MRNSLRKQQNSLARRASLLLMGMVLLILWLGHARMAVQAQGETRAYLNPSASEALVGDTIRVDIVIEDVAELYGVDVRLSFDPALLEPQDADPGTAGVQIHEGTFPAPDFAVRNEADIGVGTVWYAASQQNPTEPVSGSGVAASITFKGLAAGTSSVAFTYQKIVKRDGERIPAGTQDGQISVVFGEAKPTSTTMPKPKRTDTPAPTPTPVPPTAPLATESPSAVPPTATPPTEAPTTVPPTATPSPRPTSTPTTVSETPKTPPPTPTSRPPSTAPPTEAPTAVPPMATPTARPTSTPAPMVIAEATEVPSATPTSIGIPTPTAEPDATEEQAPSSTPFPTVSSSGTSGILANGFPYAAIIFLGATAVVAIQAIKQLQNR